MLAIWLDYQHLCPRNDKSISRMSVEELTISVATSRIFYSSLIKQLRLTPFSKNVPYIVNRKAILKTRLSLSTSKAGIIRIIMVSSCICHLFACFSRDPDQCIRDKLLVTPRASSVLARAYLHCFLIVEERLLFETSPSASCQYLLFVKRYKRHNITRNRDLTSVLRILPGLGSATASKE